MYRMVLSGYTPLWVESIFKKKLNLAQPILYKFLFYICFLGALITLGSSKTTHFWGWVHDSFFPSWLRLSGKILCMFSFPFFHFWCTANMFVPCKSSVCFWVFFCVMRLRLGCKLSWFLSLKLVVASSFASPLECTTKGCEVENSGTLGPI